MSSVVFFLSHLSLFKLVCGITSGNNPVKTVPQHYADLYKAETQSDCSLSGKALYRKAKGALGPLPMIY